jgi:hypothetical protein
MGQVLVGMLLPWNISYRFFKMLGSDLERSRVMV